MKITPTTLTISQLFSSNNEQFFIPAYQRRYSWEYKQLRELFDDINFLKNNDTHLLGSILCLTDTHKAGINSLELVDGQQRIASLSLLLKAFQNRYLELEDEDSSKEINNFLFCRGIDKKPKHKIELGDLDGPDYSKVLRQEDLDQVQNDKLKLAYACFALWLSALEIDQINNLYFKLVNSVIVIRLDVGQSKDAYKLFETINNRGLKLSPTDIIKNFLLGHASLIRDDILKKVRDDWKEVIINLDRIDTDDFFRQYMCGILTRKVTFSHLIDEFKRHYTRSIKEAHILSAYSLYNKFEIRGDEDSEDGVEQSKESAPIDVAAVPPTKAPRVSITDFARALKQSSLLYKKLLARKFDNAKINQHLFNLQRIKSFPAYIFLLNLFKRKVDDAAKIDILALLETFMLRRHVCEYRTNELDDIFSYLVEVDNEDIVSSVKNYLAQYLPDNREFETKFASHNYKGNENRAKYVLECFEYHLIQDKGEYVLSTGADLHLEHIIPLTISTKKAKQEFGDWVSYLGKDAVEQHKKYVNTIGNLTLLGQKLNIVASNNPFEAKLVEYRKSNIALTREISKRYRDFRFGEVLKRAAYFSKLAPSIWSFK